jgi:hypothetical protein
MQKRGWLDESSSSAAFCPARINAKKNPPCSKRGGLDE